MHLLHKQTMKGTQRYPLAKGIMSVCTNNKGEREREHHEWRQLLLSYARQPEGHYLALIAGQILQGCMVNQVFVSAHTSVVDFLEFDTSLQWKAKLADFILRKEKFSFRMSYNKSKSIT